MVSKQLQRQKRHKKIRSKIIEANNRLRLVVFRSNKHIYLQLIDDKNGKVLVHSSDIDIKDKNDKLKKVDLALKVGESMAKKCLEKNIKSVVFDRGGYKYHGRVKATAEGARKGGLSF